MSPIEFHSGLLQASLQAGLLATVLLTLRHFAGHRIPARLFCIGWCLVALRLVLPTVPGISFNPLPTWANSTTLATAPLDASLTVISLDSSTNGKVPSTSSTQIQSAWSLLEILLAIWIVGAVVFLAGLFSSNRRITRLLAGVTSNNSPQLQMLFDACRRQCGLRRDVRLAFSDDVNTPALIGWLRPTVVLPTALPSRLSNDELRCVFLHELIHVRRHDIALNWLASVLQALHWFNPVVWLAFRCWRSDREVLCDRTVLKVLSKPQHAAYRQTLLALLECADRPAIAPCEAGLFQTKWELSRRISFMTAPDTHTLRYSVVFVAILAFTATAVFTRAEDAPKPAKDAPPSTDSFQLRIYDINDLVGVAKAPPQNAGAAPEKNAPAKDELQMKSLLATIKKILDTDARSTFDNNAGRLIINASPAKHAQVEKVLGELRKERGAQILVESRFVTFDSSDLKPLLEKHPDDSTVIHLGKAEIKALTDLNGSTISSPRVVALNGQRAEIKIGTYAEDAKGDDAELLRGIAMEVKPILSSDRRYVTLETKALIRTDEHTFKTQTTFTQPDGATTFVILGGLQQNGRMQTQGVLLKSQAIEFDPEH